MAVAEAAWAKRLSDWLGAGDGRGACLMRESNPVASIPVIKWREVLGSGGTAGRPIKWLTEARQSDEADVDY